MHREPTSRDEPLLLLHQARNQIFYTRYLLPVAFTRLLHNVKRPLLGGQPFTCFGRLLVRWVLQLVAVDVVLLTAWTVMDRPSVVTYTLVVDDVGKRIGRVTKDVLLRTPLPRYRK